MPRKRRSVVARDMAKQEETKGSVGLSARQDGTSGAAFFEIREAMAIHQPFPPPRRAKLRIAAFDEMFLAAARAKSQGAIAVRRGHDPILVDLVAIRFALGRWGDVSRSRTGMGADLRQPVDDQRARFVMLHQFNPFASSSIRRGHVAATRRGYSSRPLVAATRRSHSWPAMANAPLRKHRENNYPAIGVRDNRDFDGFPAISALFF
jgi:hypothetical protein